MKAAEKTKDEPIKMDSSNHLSSVYNSNIIITITFRFIFEFYARMPSKMDDITTDSFVNLHS